MRRLRRIVARKAGHRVRWPVKERKEGMGGGRVDAIPGSLGGISASKTTPGSVRAASIAATSR